MPKKVTAKKEETQTPVVKAKGKTAKAAPKAAVSVEAKIVKVADLAEEYSMNPRVLRQKLRAAGLRAPAVDTGGAFGPHARYEWAEGSKELAKVREILSAVETEDEEEEEE